MTDLNMAPPPEPVFEQARSTDLFSPEAQTPSSVIPFPDYIDLLSPDSDVLSNRFGNGHDLPSALNEEAVVQLAEIERGKSLHAEVRQEPAWLAHISEEISSTPYYPLQPLSIWQHPTKGIGRYRSGYVKLPPGSYNHWITGKRDEKTGVEKEGSVLGTAVSRVNILQLASNLTCAAAPMSAVDPEHSRAQAEGLATSTGSEQRSGCLNPPATPYNIRMTRDGSILESAVPPLDRIRLAFELTAAAARRLSTAEEEHINPQDGG